MSIIVHTKKREFDKQKSVRKTSKVTLTNMLAQKNTESKRQAAGASFSERLHNLKIQKISTAEFYDVY